MVSHSVEEDVHNTKETRGASFQKAGEGEREIVGKRTQEKAIFPFPTLDFWYVWSDQQLVHFLGTIEWPSMTWLLSFCVEVTELGEVIPSKCLYFQGLSLISHRNFLVELVAVVLLVSMALSHPVVIMSS